MDWLIILTGALILITAYYAWQTKRLADHAEKIRKIERLQREMELISDLYSRRDDKFYFNSLPLIVGGDFPDSMDHALFYAAYEFWINAKKNMYLTPKPTRDRIKKFVELKLGQRDIVGQLSTYNAWKKEITDAAEDRYMEITKELEKMEEEPKHQWQFWK
jgi:coenzyme F420-reducing hydrogenase alpha subunit